MNKLGERLLMARKAKNLTQQELARKAGVTQTTISDIERGRNQTTVEAPALAKALGVSVDYLLTGNAFEFVPVAVWDDDTPLDSDEVEIPFYKEFLVSCGNGVADGEATDKERRRLRLSKKTLSDKGIERGQAAAMTAKGNSMSPVINHGDTVFVDLGRNRIKDGKIFFVEHGGLFKFKYLYALPMGGVRIVSANSEEFPEERLTTQQVIDEEFKIIGWAFSWQTMDSW